MNTKDGLTTLPFGSSLPCECCGEQSAVLFANQCCACYASGIGHGGCPCCLSSAVSFVLEVFDGRLNQADQAKVSKALGVYYSGAKCSDAEHPIVRY